MENQKANYPDDNPVFARITTVDEMRSRVFGPMRRHGVMAPPAALVDELALLLYAYESNLAITRNAHAYLLLVQESTARKASAREELILSLQRQITGTDMENSELRHQLHQIEKARKTRERRESKADPTKDSLPKENHK